MRKRTRLNPGEGVALTKRYLVEQRLWGATSTKNRYQDERQAEDAAAEVAAVQD